MTILRVLCAASVFAWYPAAAVAQVQPALPSPAPLPVPSPAQAPAPDRAPVVAPPHEWPLLSEFDWANHLDLDLRLDLDRLHGELAQALPPHIDPQHIEREMLQGFNFALAEPQVKVIEPLMGMFPGGDAYSSGLAALQRRQYDRAISQFERLIRDKAPRADGALYWTAFAHFRSGRSAEALQTITVLRRDYPQSRYLTDAQVLETDARRLAGQPVDLTALDNDDIKLLAIQGLRESERVVPLLQDLLAATNSLAVKQRAIYVLALSDDARAREVLLRYAKGGGNPDLQVEAIRYLATRGDADATMLVDLYGGQTDARVRRAIVRALGRPEHAQALVSLARTETNRELKTEMVQVLSTLASQSQAAADYLVELIR
jgi:outer membrane protein assembly factor BamD (BamD/ComL family)